MLARLVSAAPLALVLACGGGSAGSTVTILPTPEPETRATLAGPLCAGDRCTCRDPAGPVDAAGAPAEGHKRFEVRVGPIDPPLWVSIDGMVLFKSGARAEECFYVDLAPGDHSVRIRAHVDGGISAAVKISEYSPVTASWYDTFRFTCGAPGVCAHDELDRWKKGLAKYKRGIHDPCGSVKIKGLSWDTGRAPDHRYPEDLAMALTLQVYQFPPEKPHGDPSCAERFD